MARTTSFFLFSALGHLSVLSPRQTSDTDCSANYKVSGRTSQDTQSLWNSAISLRNGNGSNEASCCNR